MDCLKARDILGWLDQVPHAYVTLLVDCEPSFVAGFGKQRDPEVVDILEDPWSMLTSVDSTTVVLYLRPDIGAMAKLRDRDKDLSRVAGMLTESLTFALRHLREGGGVELGVCHRRFYEAMSFFWHRRGRQHKAFIPAVAVSHFTCMSLQALAVCVRARACMCVCSCVIFCSGGC